MVGSFRDGVDSGGGILTIVGQDWRIVCQISTYYWVGTVISFGDCTICIVNVYIPPTTSPYAPPTY